MSKSSRIGALILGMGTLLLLSTMGVMRGDLFLVILGAGFVGTYAILGGRNDYGNVGFLIPGMVLLAISAYAFIAEWTGSHGSLFFLSLSVAFMLVFAVHTFWFRDLQGPQRFWPLYPAGGLLIFFALIYGGEVLGWQASHKGLEMLNYAWVAALMGIGLWMMLKKPTSGRK